METIVKKLYEAMFLVDSAQAASDWDGITGAIETILKRAEAEIVSMKKWDERRLAYDIQKKSRGTYILCYFRADGQKISAIERDVKLTERIMRVLILSAETRSQEDVDKATPAEQVENRRRQALKEAAERDRAAEQAAKQKTEEQSPGGPREQKAPETSEKIEDNEKETTEPVIEISKQAEQISPLEKNEENGAAEKQDKL